MPFSLQSPVLDLILQTGPVVQGVLGILLLFSIFSWAVLFYKWRQFRAAERASRAFLERFARAHDLASLYRAAETCPQSPLATLVQEVRLRMGGSVPEAGSTGSSGAPVSSESSLTPREREEVTPSPEEAAPMIRIRRALRQAIQEELAEFENFLGFLATTGNVTPFIGLFGTVWGILNAFHQIGLQGQASLTAVAPGIAEALVATAAGLATAIPAVLGYNYYVNRLRRLATRMEAFSGDLLDFLEDHLRSRGVSSREMARLL